MGRQQAHDASTDDQRRAYMRALLRDVDALERMLESGLIESGVRRIGAEQEVALIDRAGHPAPINDLVLKSLPDSHFTTELGRFNIEINLDPIDFLGGALRELERQLNTLLTQVRAAAQ